MAKLETIEGIGDKYATTLRDAGVKTTNALLKKGSTPKGRNKIEKDTSISGKLILEWVNHCDLCRVKGVAGEYADLLEEAGVDTVPELAQRNPFRLYLQVKDVNEVKNLVRSIPAQSKIRTWVTEAKSLPRVVEY